MNPEVSPTLLANPGALSDERIAGASYRIVGTALTPRVHCQQQPDGCWLLEAPAGEWPPPGEPGTLAWRALSGRAADDAPMLSQRGPDGAWRHLSWAQAWVRSRSLASALLRRGHGVQRPIATLSGNSIEQAILRLAAMMAGVPLVHLSPAYSLLSRDHAPLKDALALAPCTALFVQDARSFAPALASLAAQDATAAAVIAVDGAADGQFRFDTLTSETIDEGALELARQAIRADTLCAVYFTSGSTGQPKAVPVTHGMLHAQQRMTQSRTPPDQRRPHVVLDWLPWHHVFAGVANLGRLLAAGGSYYIDEGRPVAGQFQATLRNLRDVSPTSYVSSPLAFSWLAAELEADDALASRFFSRLEGMGYGGASLPRETWLRMQRLALRHTGHKLPFLCGMGATETSAAGVSLYWACDDTASIGLPPPGATLKLVPLEGQADRQGRFELRTRGPHVFAGYLGRPDLTAKAFDTEGFYALGDAVRFVDAADPLRGLRFDGRVAEDFKLASGTWVRAGAVRLQAVSLLSPLITDAVVCGHDREQVGVLAWPNEAALRKLSPELASLPTAGLCSHAIVVAALHQRLGTAPRHGGTTTIERVTLLASAPSLDAGEITDKGYINQAAALRRRAVDVERLFSGDADQGVAVRAAADPLAQRMRSPHHPGSAQ